MNEKNFFVRNKSILTFLILEVLALTAFNFGDISYIFALAGGFLAVVGIFFLLNVEKNKKSLLWALIPTAYLLLISIFAVASPFAKAYSNLENIALFISLPGFFIIGYIVRKMKDVKPKLVLLVIGGGLAAITLFGLFSTIIEYGLFYSLIYKNKPMYYYNAETFNVTKEMYWLTGFQFNEVYVEYGSLFAVLCGAFLPGLLFLKPKEDRNEFIVCAVVGGIGLLTLLAIPNFKALLVLVVASSIAFIYKFLKNHKKTQKILGISFVSIVFLGLVFFSVGLIGASKGIEYQGILKRIFVENGIMQNVNAVFKEMFAVVDGSKINVNGMPPIEYNLEPHPFYTGTGNGIWIETGIFEVQLLKEIGVVGTFLFFGFVLLTGYMLLRYYRHSKDSDHVKAVLLVLVLAFFIFESLFNVFSVAVHETIIVAFIRSPLLLVVLFIIGFTFIPFGEEKTNE